MRLAALAGQRIAVLGYGREGRAMLRVLRAQLPGQAIAVFCDANEAAQVAADGDADPAVSTRPMPLSAADLADIDIAIKSPGISPYKAPYAQAVAAGLRLTSASAIWFAEHPEARTLCITGTKGKSTVTALAAHLLRARGLRVALAGNIGLPLVELWQPQAPPDWWVIELSSFQTRDFSGAPTIAVINNLLEEHLDWHGDAAQYRADKLRLLDAAALAVLNGEDPLLRALPREGAATRWFNDAAGWHVDPDAVLHGATRVLPREAIPLPGLHNAQNVCAALAAVEAALDVRPGEGLARAMTVAPAVATFRALPHRLQPLGRRDGLDFINDSISTTPYAAVEALRSVEGRRVAILIGGFDRGVSWAPFAAHVRALDAARRPVAIVVTGANRARITAVLAQAGITDTVHEAPTLAEAVPLARAMLPGDGVVLLSPGAPSFDAFRDYAERGRTFARLAGFDAMSIAQIDGLGIR